MKYLSFGKIDKSIIPILLWCIFCFLDRASRYLDIFQESTIYEHLIITPTYIAFSKLFLIIPFIIYKRRINKTNKKMKDNDINININNTYNSLELIHMDISDNIKGKIKYLLLSAFVFFIQSFLFTATTKITSNCWIFEILITSIFYYLIFKIKLYKHHYLSIALILLTGIIIDFSFENYQNDVSNNYAKFLLRLLREILYSFHDVINKYIIEYKFGSIYEIGLSNGIINLILLGIFSIFNYYFLGFDKFDEYFNNFDTNELIAVIILMITQILLYLCTLITNRNYTPCHIFIIFVFGQLGIYINLSGKSIILIICLIFILFFSLIFNEIIEINVFWLLDNTKRKIILRAESEDKDLDKKETMDVIAIDEEIEMEVFKNEIYD